MAWRAQRKQWHLGRWIRLSITIVLAFALVSLALIWWLTSAAPGWWSAAGVLPADAGERASALERGGSRAMSEPRDESKPWTVSISESDANAWLTHRLILWAENRGIEDATLVTSDGGEVVPPRVSFEAGRVRMGIEINGRIIGLCGAPVIERGALFVRESRLFLGRLELSHERTSALAQTISDRLMSHASDEVRSMLRVLLEGSGAIADPARFALDDGREIVLERLVIEDDRVLVTCRTLAPHR